MDQANEPVEDMSDMPIAGQEAPESVDSSIYGPPPPQDQGQAPGISHDPGVPGFAPPPTYAPPTYAPPAYDPQPNLAAPPGVGPPPPGVGQGPYQYYGQGYPIAPRPRNRRTVVIIASVGTVVVLLVAGLVALGLSVFRHVTSTANVQVIIPPPAKAGGLNQAYAVERQPEAKRYLDTVRQTITAEFHGKFTGYAIALYSDAPANNPTIIGTVHVLYVGLNSSSPNYDTATTLKDELAGIATSMNSVTTLPISSGPGNTSYGCEIGNQTAPQGLEPAAVCAWTTDRTTGFLFESGSVGTDVTQLAALEKKMEPDLVTG